MTTSPIPACPACGASAGGWIIDSPVGAIDRVRLDGSGIEHEGLLPPTEGLSPLGRPEIRCAACAAAADDERLRDGVLSAAIAIGRDRGAHPPH